MKDMFSGMGVRLPGATLFAFATLQAIWVFPVVLGALFLLMTSIVFLPGLRGNFSGGCRGIQGSHRFAHRRPPGR